VAQNDGLKTTATELNQELPFSILEDFIEKEEPSGSVRVLRVTVVYPTNLRPGIDHPPIVMFEGYKPEEVDPEEFSRIAGSGKLPIEESRVALSRLMVQDSCEAPPDDGTSARHGFIAGSGPL